jgi:hypothetical protein
MINHNPSFLFGNNYTFNIEINRRYGDSTMVEIIHKHNDIKRKNIWNYKTIDLNILNYEAKKEGFEYINEYKDGFIKMVIFRKKY